VQVAASCFYHGPSRERRMRRVRPTPSWLAAWFGLDNRALALEAWQAAPSADSTSYRVYRFTLKGLRNEHED